MIIISDALRIHRIVDRGQDEIIPAATGMSWVLLFFDLLTVMLNG
jgi:hypothetical protein